LTISSNVVANLSHGGQPDAATRPKRNIRRSRRAGESRLMCEPNSSDVLFTTRTERFIFNARRYASAVYAVALSVRLSVRLSQVGVLLKRLNIKSHKQRRTIGKGLKNLDKFPPGSPPTATGVPNAGRNFQQITRYISKTVQDRRIVSVKVE